MPVKTFLMSDIPKSPPRTPLEDHRAATGKGSYNRFGPLLPEQGGRQRLQSTGKRRLAQEDQSGPSNKVAKLDANRVFDQLKVQDSLMNSAKTLLTEVGAAAGTFSKVDDGGIGTVIYKLTQVMDCIINSNENLKSALIDVVNAKSTSGGTGQQDGRQAGGNQGNHDKVIKPTPSAEDIAKAKVKKVLREAERRTVVFDLNLGAAPIMNKESISKQVTKELHNKARTVKHDWAIDSASTMVDDMLSCSQLEFLGSGTRKFYNNRNKDDPRNNNMCTVPVRFDFKNKETRINAEKTLKKICNTRCAVPYPKKLRDMLTSLIQEGKDKAKGSFINTKVDIDNLKIKAMIWSEADKRMQDLGITKDIPINLLDVSQVEIEIEEIMVEDSPLS